MAISFDNVWSGIGTASGTSLATGSATPAASATLLVAVYTTNTTATGITDNTGSNVWNLLPAVGVGTLTLQLGYVVNPANTNTVITAHSGSAGSISVCGGSFKGTATVTPFDKSMNNNSASAGTALDSLATATTTYPNEVLIGYGECGGAANVVWTTGAGYSGLTTWSTGTSGAPLYLIYQIVSGTGTYNATATLNVAHSWAAAIATFADTNVSPSVSASVAWVTA